MVRVSNAVLKAAASAKDTAEKQGTDPALAVAHVMVAKLGDRAYKAACDIAVRALNPKFWHEVARRVRP